MNSFQSDYGVSQQLNQIEQIVHKLVQQTQQASMQYQQLLQQEQSNAIVLQQISQREQQASQIINQALQGHQTAIQQLNQISGLCNQLEGSSMAYQSSQSSQNYGIMDQQQSGRNSFTQH